jgi:molybdenum ABC transporter molybdate-binding protein
MISARAIFLGSVVLAAGLIVALWYPNRPSTSKATSSQPLVLYCAAGLKSALEPAVQDYQERYHTPVHIQYGGSGTLLGNLKVAPSGDLFLAADTFHLDLARTDGLVAEILPLAHLNPVLAVARGNPKQLRNLDDLLRPGVQFVLANPEAAAVGRLVRHQLESLGRWQTFSQAAKAFKPTVNDLANDLKIGAADAAIVWDATVRQYPELEALPLAEFTHAHSSVALGVLHASRQPQAALHFARFLTARDAGLPHFAQHGFTVIDGDRWVETPDILFYSGGVNRVAIEDTLQQFEQREGIRIRRVYNGCGILTAQIRAGQKPDGYFACDVPFLDSVQTNFHPGLKLAETSAVIATPPGNPLGLLQLSDLTRPGLKLGVANEQQSALGTLTANLLRQNQLFDGVMSNVVVQTPTADLLVHQLRLGGLDAVIVYRVNTIAASNAVHVVPIHLPGAVAVQPLAIGRHTEFPHLLERLAHTLRAAESQERFRNNGFRWLDLSVASP